MRTAIIISVCLMAVLVGCSSNTGAEDEDTVWTEFFRWEGDTVKITETFQIDSAFWRITWDTHSYAAGQKRFRVQVYDNSGESNHALIADVVNTDGPDQGSMIIRRTGVFFVQIDARQPYTVVVEVPD